MKVPGYDEILLSPPSVVEMIFGGSGNPPPRTAIFFGEKWMNTTYLWNRLAEPSTWRGITLFLGGLGILSKEQMDLLTSIDVTSIVSTVMIIIGVIGTFLPDKIDKPKEE